MAALVALLLLDTHVKMPTFALLDAERCESGRIDMLGKHASRQRDRGFESHPLRHQRLLDHRLANRGDGIDIVTVTGPGPVQQNPVNPARSGRKQR